MNSVKNQRSLKSHVLNKKLFPVNDEILIIQFFMERVT